MNLRGKPFERLLKPTGYQYREWLNEQQKKPSKDDVEGEENK